jgi:hypothetical protein
MLLEENDPFRPIVTLKIPTVKFYRTFIDNKDYLSFSKPLVIETGKIPETLRSDLRIIPIMKMIGKTPIPERQGYRKITYHLIAIGQFKKYLPSEIQRFSTSGSTGIKIDHATTFTQRSTI